MDQLNILLTVLWMQPGSINFFIEKTTLLLENEIVLCPNFKKLRFF